MESSIVNKLEKIGGKFWSKNGMNRVYFDYNQVLDHAKLATSRYGSGNISSATLNDESISNSEAKKIINDLQQMKFWFDLNDNNFKFKNFGFEQSANRREDMINEFANYVKEILVN